MVHTQATIVRQAFVHRDVSLPPLIELFTSTRYLCHATFAILMHCLGHRQAPPTPSSAATSDDTLIQTLSVCTNGLETQEQIAVVNNVPLERIADFRIFSAALKAIGANHKPVSVRYIPNSLPPCILSHAECKLRDVSHIVVLQHLLGVSTLTSLVLHLPPFTADPVPALSASTLTSLTLAGELPCAYQFLAALYAPALDSLSIRFHRNQWDHLNNLSDCMRDEAYAIQLAPQSFPALRKVFLEEHEPSVRWTDVSVSCALGPLLFLTALEEVTVRMDASPLWVSDADVALVALAWQFLTKLEFACTRAAMGLPTLAALRYLEAGCRDLVELVLPPLDLDAEEDSETAMAVDVPSGEASAAGALHAPVGGHPLRTLRMACQRSKRATGECAFAFGQCIDSLFPNLEADLRFVQCTKFELYASEWYPVWLGIQAAKSERNMGRSLL